MAHTFRGGRPWNRNLSVTTGGAIGLNGDASSVQAAGAPYEFPMVSSELQMEVTSGTEVQLFWTSEDYAAGANPLRLLSGKPRNIRATANRFWLKAIDADAVLEVVALGRT